MTSLRVASSSSTTRISPGATGAMEMSESRALTPRVYSGLGRGGAAAQSFCSPRSWALAGARAARARDDQERAAEDEGATPNRDDPDALTEQHRRKEHGHEGLEQREHRGMARG